MAQEETKMYTFKVTYRNDETGKTRTYAVKADGILPAIEKAKLILESEKHWKN